MVSFDPKNIRLPDLKLPDLKLPDLKLPEVKLPDIKFPELKPNDMLGFFSVDEEKLREILQQVRSELPTTEAILLGKPQTGKSSVVRALTGGDATIVGQGFRPHTQHTTRYAYPTEDLPLLTFVDTVGLGDGRQAVQEIVSELSADIQTHPASRIFIVTVKVGDFATDSLKQIVRALRSQFPQVPCLLTITCLHEGYPSLDTEHPPYPPEFDTLTRAVTQIRSDFAGLFDASVMVDFTLEEDGFDPVLYGLEPFVTAIGDLLPEAESRAIAQLVQNRDVSTQFSDLYRSVGRRYILPFSLAAGTCAAVPLPLATMPVLTGIQISMITLLGKLYGQVLTPGQAGGLVSTIAGGFVAQTIGRELVKLIPGFGSVIAAGWATAYTWALGEAACVYFGDVMGGKTPDPKRIQEVMKTSFDEARSRFGG
jgi:uncharacterized protein (DUF697 family)